MEWKTLTVIVAGEGRGDKKKEGRGERTCEKGEREDERVNLLRKEGRKGLSFHSSYHF